MSYVIDTTAGTRNWTCPMGVYWVTVECIGGGGAGANMSTNGSGGGGGGGAYALKARIPVVPGTAYSYTVGAAGTDAASPANGGNSTFGAGPLVQAQGGASAARNSATAGAAGLAVNGIGDVNRDGGAANTGGSPSANNGGGGGGAAGRNGNGIAAAGNNGGGMGTTGTEPSLGGAGGNGAKNGSAVGSAGAANGGGGGGATRNSTTNRAGGAGSNGVVIVSYQTEDFENYKAVEAGNGISTGERIR
ncbi:MAG TPA: hypothetical protein VMV18_05585 [bacterium]|nr:hypothetical protein [bacterium]